MTHLPEERVNEEVRDHLQAYYPNASLVSSSPKRVRGDRYADIIVDRRGGGRDVAVEVENGLDASEYRDGIGQSLHYRRAGYIPVLALPLHAHDLTDPDTDSGEILNIAADVRVGLLGVWFTHDHDRESEEITGASFVLRPWNE